MIKLRKEPIPEVLEEKGAEWKRILLEKLPLGTASQTEKNRYRNLEIKRVLVSETHGKCAYCESKLRHIHHGDVEHIYPKSSNPELTFEWDNLTLACEICNQNKSDKDPEHFRIIDPYLIDPDLHLVFFGPFVAPTGTPEGISTRMVLELDRAELVERRKEKLDGIISVLWTVSRNDIPVEVRKAILNNAKEQDAGEAAEYSAMVKSAIREFVRHLPPEVAA